MTTIAAAAALARSLRGLVTDERVLAAIERVPRHEFVPPDLRTRAWDNEPLPIGHGQTISQPLVVAHMCELLEVAPGDRVLDVGTGSGYHAAVLAALGALVWTIEVRPALARSAQRAFDRAAVSGVTPVIGDGAAGLPDAAPFDAVNVAAAGDEARLGTLLAQLAPGGRLIAPVGDRRQLLVRFRLGPDGLERTEHGKVRFVRMVTR